MDFKTNEGAMDNEIIRKKKISNIEKKDDIFNVGFIESKLFNQKIEVWIENTVDMDYAEKCVSNFQSLNNENIDRICERISAYHKFMLEEWNEEFVETDS